MQRFMCLHTVPPGSITEDQVFQITTAAQNDPVVRGYRSFLNLSEGKMICILEAPDAKSLAQWFDKMNLPYDNITAVEWEGERGEVRNVQLAGAGQARG